MKFFGVCLILASAGVAWFMWGPVLQFFLSIVPATAAHAWVGKLLCIALVGWFGGVGIPLALLIFGIIALVTR